MNRRWILRVAGVLGGLGVAIGAFGAHWLPGHLSGMGIDAATITRRLDQFDVGARYHLVHAVALLALAGLPSPPKSIGIVAWLWIAGTTLFSGSLYLLVLTDTPWLGAVTPLGGVCWIVAWSLLAVSRYASARHNISASGIRTGNIHDDDGNSD